MDKKTLSSAVLAIGILILVVSLFADSFGIGDHPDFGPNQTIGSIVGVIVAAIGLFLMMKAK